MTVNETNPLVDPAAYYAEPVTRMDLAGLAAAGGRVTRVRWIGGEYIPGRGRCFDLSYVHGEVNGQRVMLVGLPGANLVPSAKRRGVLVDWAKECGVYAKAIGLLDEGATSTLS